VTLRTRLTAAFLVVVLGPVLLGAVFVSYTVGAVSRDRSAHQLDVAAGAVASAVAGLCQQLHTAAELLAQQPPEQRSATAAELVERDPFAAVRLPGPDGEILLGERPVPPQPWAECGGPAGGADGRYAAIATRVPAPPAAGGAGSAGDPARGGADPAGAERAGGGSGGQGDPAEVWVAARLDQQVVERLAAAAGVSVTLLGPSTPLHTTDDAVGSSVAAAELLPAGEVAESVDGKWVRRLEPTDGQPLPLVLAAPGTRLAGLLPLLSAVIVGAGVLAVLAAWRLAATTTRPLVELAQAADRIAEGDLSVRVPVRAGDETGRLAATFNRMTHRTQSYVQALTASRDQLRRHLTVLGETLSSTHDQQRILQVILQTAQAATAASAGAVLLADQRAGTLVGHATRGSGQLAGSLTPVTVPLGEGLLGGVAATGEARRGRVGERAPILHPAEPRCRTYVVVPISAPSGAAMAGAPWPAPPAVRGVLALYDRLGGDEFDDTDMITLRTFAGQAGVAVDNVHAHEEAQRLSLTDSLTGLWNHRSLRESVRREVERASRFNHPLAALALDLDRFKEVNDAHGHPAGDSVLAEFAGRIRSEVREVDLAFRQGGEEFVILLPETDTRGATVLAQRLGAAVRDAPVVISPRGTADGELSIRVTVSVGIAVYPEHAVAPQELLDAADTALYAAKAAGRDTYRVAPPRLPEADPAAGPAAQPPAAAELPVRASAARTSADDLPRAGPEPAGDPAGDRPPSGGAQPPQPSCGR
jgi:diguanylate cyclase (GGDEF)-like protein